MARKKSNKKRIAEQAAKEAAEAAKKHPHAFITVVAVILIIAIIAGVCWYFLIYKKKGGAGTTGGTGGTPQAGVGRVTEITSADLSIHFLAPAVKASGDCALVKVGNTEVLIDAGPTQENAGAIKKYVDKYCTDGILEYVIATHADKDHIAAFVGTSSNGSYNGILYSYKVETLIQFDLTNQKTATDKGNDTLYGKYVKAVEHAEGEGTKVYTASQCYYERDGAQKTYYLNEAQTISMNILYNEFYEKEDGDENNYSVCTLFSQKLSETETNHYLFTGDLEKEGEEALVKNNTLPEVVLYKAGHHGSKTSSNDCLLRVIKPKYVVVCCCAGYNQYGAKEENVFPTQAFINRISAYTDKIYIPIMFDKANNSFKNMNGDVVFYYGKGESETEKQLKLWCSENSALLKDTEWFKANRTWNGGA